MPLTVFGFFFIFALGGLTGVMLAIVPFKTGRRMTAIFVVRPTSHYGSWPAHSAFPMLAAFYYWLPLLTGRTARAPLVGARLLAGLHRLST